MERLTSREREVAILVQEGLCNQEIADRIYVSRHTVKAILEDIYEKLQFNNRVKLAVYVYKALLDEKAKSSNTSNISQDTEEVNKSC